MNHAPFLTLTLAVVLLLVGGFGLLLVVSFPLSGMDTGTPSSLSSTTTPATSTTPSGTQATASDGPCYSASPYAQGVVALATQMANALYVNPACGNQRGGNCNATWYTSAFPRAVVQYGQQCCQAHNDCSDWATGT